MKTLKVLFFTLFLAAVVFPIAVVSYDYYQLPGIKDYQYVDADKFPWSPPYRPEHLAWQMYASRRPHGWMFTTRAALVNHEGHIRHYTHRVTSRAYYRTYADRIPKADPTKEFIKPGTPAMKELFWWIFPPASARQAYMIWDYYDTPTLRKDADRFLFFPTSKMVRRMGGGDRSDTVGGGDFTYDDILGREVFESDHKAIGVDYLYLDELSFNFGKLEFAKQHMDKLVHMEMPWQKEVGMEGMPLTSMGCTIHPDLIPTEEKPLECVVVESTSKIPDYYLSKIITWYVLPNKNHPACDVREEHYDRDGNLWRIRTRAWTYWPSPHDPSIKWYFHVIEHIWDIAIDHQSIHSFNFVPIPYDQQDKMCPESMYIPNNLPTLKDPNYYEIGAQWDQVDEKLGMYENFRPWIPDKQPLFPDKFPDHRKIASHLMDRDYIKADLAKEQDRKKAHPDRKTWCTFANAPEHIKKMVLEH